MAYGYTNDNVGSIGYISKEKILQYVTEEEIFQLVFGYQPREFERVVSPFREDKSPGCWFERRGDTLRFVDYASKDRFFPDCFDAVQQHYGLPNFYKTLEFIYQRLIEGRTIVPVKKKQTTLPVNKKTVINIQSRDFISDDAIFWSAFGISRRNLIDDNVFPVSRYVIERSRGDLVDETVRQLCYAFTGFDESRKKLYFPNSTKTRFITNCTKDDIGSINTLPLYGNQLIISKSYKDCRIIRNTARSSIWLQNEGMFPNSDLLFSIIRRFKNVVVFFDNDRKGMQAAVELVSLINNTFPDKARAIWLPETYKDEGITDPGDLYKTYGEQRLLREFHSFLI